MALATPDHGGEQVALALAVELHYEIHYLFVSVAHHRLARYRGVGRGGTGVEQAQEVVDFGNGTHGGPRVVAGGLLFYGNDGAESLYALHLGLLEYAHKMFRIGRERVHIASLSLCVKGVEGKRGLAASAESGHNDEFPPWQFEGHILEIMGSGPCDSYLSVVHQPSSSRSKGSLKGSRKGLVWASSAMVLRGPWPGSTSMSPARLISFPRSVSIRAS